MRAVLLASAAVAAAAVLSAGASQHVPVFAWSSAAGSLEQAEAHAHFGRSNLEGVLAGAAAAAAAGQSALINVFIADQLLSDDASRLAGAHGNAAKAPLSPVVSAVKGAASSLVVARADMGGEGGLAQAAAAQLAAAGCHVQMVAAEEGAAVLSRSQYLAALKEGSAAACRAYVVPLAGQGSTAALVGELAWMQQALEQAGSAGSSTMLLNVLTSEPVALPEAEEAGAEEALEAARFLQASPSPKVSVAPAPVTMSGIRIIPEMATGLIIGGFLLFVVWIGVSCVSTVKTPDILHSTTLMAGKEY